MLVLCSSRARRASAVVPSPPNMRSNTTRGFSSIGNGCVGVRHEIVSMYVQRKSAAHVPKMFELSSIASSIDGNVVPWPIFCAMT